MNQPCTKGAAEKIREALKQIEAAQVALDRACQAISPVVGLVKEWKDVGALSDKVKAQYHHLNELDGPFRLDSEPRQP